MYSPQRMRQVFRRQHLGLIARREWAHAYRENLFYMQVARVAPAEALHAGVQWCTRRFQHQRCVVRLHAVTEQLRAAFRTTLIQQLKEPQQVRYTAPPFNRSVVEHVRIKIYVVTLSTPHVHQMKRAVEIEPEWPRQAILLPPRCPFDAQVRTSRASCR